MYQGGLYQGGPGGAGIPDQGMSRKDSPVKSLVFADGVRQRQEKLGE
jgi:hypothetical protein